MMLTLRYSLLVGTLFLVLGLFLPFWPVLLELRGVSAADIGLLLAATTWIKIAGLPLWGRLADRRGDVRHVLALLGLGSLVAYLWLGVAQGFAWLLLGHLLLGFFFNPLIPITDSEILKAGRSRGLDYGRIRLWGSIAFIIGNFVGGEIVELADGLWFLGVIVGSLAVTFGVSLSLPRMPRRPRHTRSDGWRVLLGDRRFLALVLTAGCLQASHAAYYAVASITWLAAGHSESTIAWLWAEGVLVEILLLAYGSRLLHRLGPVRLLTLAGLAGIVRWTATGLSSDLPLLIAVQALHALTFAAAHLGTVHLIARVVPATAAASGQSLYAALQGGVMLGLALILSGYLYDISPAASFAAMAALSAAGLLLSLAWRRRLGQE